MHHTAPHRRCLPCTADVRFPFGRIKRHFQCDQDQASFLPLSRWRTPAAYIVRLSLGDQSKTLPNRWKSDGEWDQESPSISLVSL